MDQTIKIGVSSCLLGKEVRYNGGHSHDRYITATLGQYFTFVDVCPEVEAGFGIPRETLRLVGDPDAPRHDHHPGPGLRALAADDAAGPAPA